jgi:hypothetical protein
MSFNSLVRAISITVLALALGGTAQANPATQPSADWLTCEASDNCIIISHSCCADRAVNSQYRADAEAVSKSQCGSFCPNDPYAPGTSFAVCENRHCVAKKKPAQAQAKPATQFAPDWLTCQAADDCAIISHSCCADHAVNSRYKANAEAVIKSQCASSCPKSPYAPGTSFAVCENRQCVAKKSPH